MATFKEMREQNTALVMALKEQEEFDVMKRKYLNGELSHSQELRYFDVLQKRALAKILRGVERTNEMKARETHVLRV